jgi:hypothetical protein
MKLSRLLVFASLTALCAPLLVAKCAGLHYVLSGRVTDAQSREPIAGAVAAVLVNGQQPEPWGPERYMPAVTGADGTFGSDFFFDTFSHFSRCAGDECARVPLSLSLVVSAPGHESRTYSLKGSAIPAGSGEEPIAVVVPEAALALTPHTPTF